MSKLSSRFSRVDSLIRGSAWLQRCFSGPIVFVLVVLAGFAFQNQERQNPRWTAPYFSAAANFQLGQGFYIDVEDARQHFQLRNYEAERQYRFRRSQSLSHYNHNPFGFVYVILLATTLFGGLVGDIQSLLILQILAHAASTVATMNWLKTRAAKTALVTVYGINPLILHFVTLDFYYFWQALPSLALAALYFKRPRRSHLPWIVWGMALAMVLSIRLTTIAAVGLVFAGLWRQEGWRRVLLPLVVCVAVFFLIDFDHKNLKKNP